jgi:hypothetical protein
MEMKTAIPLAEAQRIADAVLMDLQPHCERIQVAGSVWRQKPEVGDLELGAIPKMAPGGHFGSEPQNMLLRHLQGRPGYRILKGKRADAHPRVRDRSAHPRVRDRSAHPHSSRLRNRCPSIHRRTLRPIRPGTGWRSSGRWRAWMRF